MCIRIFRLIHNAHIIVCIITISICKRHYSCDSFTAWYLNRRYTWPFRGAIDTDTPKRWTMKKKLAGLVGSIVVLVLPHLLHDLCWTYFRPRHPEYDFSLERVSRCICNYAIAAFSTSPSFSAPPLFGALALDVDIISGPKSFARQEATSANKNGYHGQASLFLRIRICLAHQ